MTAHPLLPTTLGHCGSKKAFLGYDVCRKMVPMTHFCMNEQGLLLVFLIAN